MGWERELGAVFRVPSYHLSSQPSSPSVSGPGLSRTLGRYSSFLGHCLLEGGGVERM